jgi:exodeoxyribonuclease-5
MTPPIWNAQQSAALDAVGRWLHDPTAPQIFRLFGYAGTGKTTLARYLAEQEDGLTLFAAYTGKAASVLRERGCLQASTLHSLLYSVRDKDRSELLRLRALLAGMEPKHPDYLETKAMERAEVERVRAPSFSVNEESVLKDASLLVVDEVSMVGERIGRDVENFKKKVLVLGDPAQLPPVKGGGYFTDCTPDILLTEIHRQAADNPIIRWATLARRGEVIPFGDAGLAKKFKREKINDAWLARSAGQILCGKNETRRNLNTKIRKQLGRKSPYPEDGDSLVCLMNDHKLGVLNGVICSAHGNATTETEHADSIAMNIHYEGRILYDQEVDEAPFRGMDGDPFRKFLQLDYGYALTVHKSQGSQWKTITLYDDGFGKRDPEVRRRWLYTAITRAEHQLNIVTS